MLILLISLVILFIFSYIGTDKQLAAPSSLFCLSFIGAAFFALLNQEKWSLILDHRTYWIIVLSVFEFVLFSIIIWRIFKYFSNNQLLTYEYGENEALKDINNLNGKLILLIIIQLIIIYLISIELKRVTGLSNIFQAMSYYNFNANNNLTMDLSMPRSINLISNFSIGTGLYAEFIIAKNIAVGRKLNYFLVLVAFLGLVTSMIYGSRGGAIIASLSFIIYLLIELGRKSGWKPINSSIYIKILVGIVTILILLQGTSYLFQRKGTESNLFEYISIYIGAEIKNLDIFIRNGLYPVKGSIWGEQTFYSLIPVLAKIKGITVNKYFLNIPFQMVNGYNLGNVYTTFYSWLYDFGYKGVPVLTAIMAVTSSVAYCFAIKNKEKNYFGSISVIFYGYIGSLVGLSFFSNKFYEGITTSLIYYLLTWYILNLFFNIKFKN
ncbi:O-antigen polymerase [uncultured Lactobacillus sp.]|uniref:O-antigen polymerase n=1 Tax=uncultured Lactobacillus sp. TaxID=153152 RepID=UPI0028039BAD|nr:O-antigen polymerase [uncultured Lactobacillus sp.]